jgi:hypothetical protein
MTYIARETQQKPERRGGKPWLEITLLSAFIVSLLIGLFSLALFFLYSNSRESNLDDTPLTAFDPELVLPSLAIKYLAGDPANALAYQALNAGELNTSHALALFDTVAYGSQRAGLMIRLARALQESNYPDQAAQVYRLSQALAILDPTILPNERNQTLTQVAEGFLAVDDKEAANDSVYQALYMGARLPGLLPAQRSAIFTNLIPIAEALDDEQLLETVEELARNPFIDTAGSLPTPQLRILAEALTPEETLISAQAGRQQAAKQLTDRLQFTGGTDVEPERQALEAALRYEDQVRAEYFGRTVGSGLTPQQQLWLVNQQRAWIALKTQIALKGFGMTLVPEWEQNSDGILQNLNTITSNMDVTLDALANAQPTPNDQATLQAEGLQWLALQNDLGLYPGAPVSNLSQRLEVAQAALADLGQPLALPVLHKADATPPGFRLIPPGQ